MNTNLRVIQDLRVIQALSNQLDDLKKKNQALERKKQALNKGPNEWTTLEKLEQPLSDGMKKIMEVMQRILLKYGCSSVIPHNS